MSRGITTSFAAVASVTVADSLSTAHVKTSLAPGCTLTTKFSVRRAQDTNSLSVFFNGGGFPKPFVSTKVGLVRAGLAAANTAAIPLSAQGTGASLTRLGRDFVADFAVVVADFAVVALAAMLDATVDSESSTQAIVQRAVLDPSHAIHQ